jgi:ABC-type branched-subunit amino acid transport system substrate-binding protein
MLLAIEYLNQHGGVEGRPFRLATRDTHSEQERSLRGLEQLLDEGIVALIGPDEVDTVRLVRSHLATAPSMAHLLPNSVTLSDLQNDGTGLLVRLAPAAELAGCALADKVYADGMERLAVLYSDDPYQRAFGRAVAKSFEAFRFAPNIGTALAVPLDAQLGDSLASLRTALAFEPEAIVLALDTSVAANVVQAGSTLGEQVRWLCEPGLRNAEFLQNVSQSSIQGAFGVSLALPDREQEFRRVFFDRWSEEPLVESYLYFDAVVAVGLATIAAQTELGRAALPKEIADQVLPVFQAPGTSVSWLELKQAKTLLEDKRSIRYVGAGGPLALDRTGLLDPATALLRFWVVGDGGIVSEEFGACPPGTPGINAPAAPPAGASSG